MSRLGISMHALELALRATWRLRFEIELSLSKTWILFFQVLSRWKRYSFGADIFSFGCVIAFFVNRGKHLFPDDSKVRKWRGLRKDDIISGYSSDLFSLICSTLDPEHRRRPAARGLLQLCTKEKLKVTSVNQSSLYVCESWQSIKCPLKFGFSSSF